VGDVARGSAREALVRLLARQRYGIHAMLDEHFGIAVAEMVRAGCIVFVSQDGGPREIVGDEPRRLFASIPDAIRKVRAVIDDPALQGTLRAHLARRGTLFSAERFVRELRAIVRAAGAEKVRMRGA
jgi:glycosyltransferase involved in cell wall biosynthesis